MMKLLYVARPVPHKGLSDLLKALRLIVEMPFSLSVVGGMGFATDAPLLTPGDPLAAKVHDLGAMPLAKVAETMREHDLLVVPSRYENFCNVALEGLASGLPVIGTALGGLRDMIDPGVNGYLVEPGNPEALARILSEVISAPEQVAAMSRNARQVATRHSWDIVSEMTSDMLKSLIKLKLQGDLL